MPFRIVLALLLALAAPAARADEACDLAARLTQIEALSHRARSATNLQAATRLIDQMTGQIHQIPPRAGRLIADELRSYELAAFLESRSRMAFIFGDQGLAAAQRYAAEPAYDAKAAGVLALGGLLDCAKPASSAAAAPTARNGALPRMSDRQAQSVRQITGAAGATTTGFGEITASLAMLGAMAAAAAIAAFVLLRRKRKRREIRYLCDIPTRVVARGETLDARILDISARGAKLMITHDFRRREPGTVVLGRHGEVAFRIAWTNQRYAGIRFCTRLPFPLTGFIQETGAKHG